MKEKNLRIFEDPPKLNPPGKYEKHSGVIKRSRGFIRITALGVSVFSLIFIMCCFLVGVNTTKNHITDTESNSAENEISSYVTSPGGNDNESSHGGGEETFTPVTPAPPSDIYEFDYSKVPPGETPIVPYDLSLIKLGKNYLYNDTGYNPCFDEIKETYVLPAYDDSSDSGEPLVLIYHTHGTEAYSQAGSISYDGKSDLGRSSDINENVVAVGAALAGTLNSHGIRTLHCTVMHDIESYRDSYRRSSNTVREYLSKYPSIKYVIDVHRDAVTDAAGSILRPVTEIDGNAVAQVMCVVGSDWSGTENSRWQGNLSFAMRIRSGLNAKYGNLCRPSCLRKTPYNQQYAEVSALLEIGTCGNYLEEAKRAARICGDTLADIITG